MMTSSVGIDNASTDKTKPYLVLIALCAFYTIGMDLRTVFLEGVELSALPTIYISLLILIGTVQTIRNKPQSLTILGTTAKIYFPLVLVFVVLSLSIIGRNWNNFLSWTYVLSVLILSVSDLFPGLRDRAALKPLRKKSISLRLAVYILPPVLLIIIGFWLLASFISTEARAFRTTPYSILLAEAEIPGTEGYTWEESIQMYVVNDMARNEQASLPGSVWYRNDSQTIHRYDENYQDKEFYRQLEQLGYESEYEFHKTIWNADLYQVIPVILKGIAFSNNLESVYHLETDVLKALLMLHRNDASNRWIVGLEIHYGRSSVLNATSIGPTRESALTPVILTLERHMKGDLRPSSNVQ
jgi:hypothetical protein